MSTGSEALSYRSASLSSPCFKLAARRGGKELALWVQESGRTGFYLRCLEPGEVGAGDKVVLLERPARGASVAEANRVMHRDKHDIVGIKRLLALPALSASWRRTLEKRLSGGRENTTPRLERSTQAPPTCEDVPEWGK
jgi:MOSC domain-containing protein YiiM